jgi:predicted ATPase
MKLQNVVVSSFRSLFDLSHDARPFELDFSDGMNLLIGPNNCGKSNVVRAIELALEPDATISAEQDLPGSAAHAQPTVELTFHIGPDDPASDLVRAVQRLQDSEDNREPTNGSTSLTFRVKFEPDEKQQRFRRRPDFGFAVPEEKRDALQRAVDLFYQRVRFVITRSGESLESILEGKFREVLRDVVSETLHDEYQQAINRRESYLDDLQAALFKPLTEQVAVDLAAIFPEVTNVELRPNIPQIDATIANLSIEVSDSAITDLAAKGTGVRGGVIAAMFRYLAKHSHHSMVFAVEEPESFLHPAAQEGLRDSLEHLAEREEITVIVTTHSPFMVPRRADAKLFALAKDPSGATRVDAVARGDEPQATLIGGLFRDPQVSYVLDAIGQVPADAEGVLVVEGTTDVSFLRTAARLLDRRTLDGVHLIASTGASAAATQAVVVQAASGVTVCSLFDNDDIGRAAYERLRGSTFRRLISKNSVLNYRLAFPGLNANLPFEAEDVFSSDLQLDFASRYPEDMIDVVEHAPDVTHLTFPHVLKSEFAAFVDEQARPEDCERWHLIFDALDKALGRVEDSVA